MSAKQDPGGEPRTDEARRDRQMIELLNELRVAIPGVQILFGFLLTVPFSNGFQQATGFQKNCLLVTLALTALSTACMIAPSAAHRLRFHEGDRPWLIESASGLLIAGLAFLAFAITSAFVLVTDFLFGGATVWVAAVATALVFAGLWFVRPLLRSRSQPR